jgi:UDP-hydrolysing UDP-N-acetyl-D-glucosamine 2-epimerase
MSGFTSLLLSPGANVREAIEVVDAGNRRTALIVDHHFRLIGIVRDADIRRGLLNGITLEDPASRIMKTEPITARPGMSRQALLSIMQSRPTDMLPIVDDAGRLVGAEFLMDMLTTAERPNDVVLMAGGFGRRLGVLTRDCPKPLLNIGPKPMLETIVESFAEQGFRRFWISVNYLADMIEQHFGDGRRWGVEINYLREDRPLGTAGALSLLPVRPQHPLVLMNGDILTKVRFDELLEFHGEGGGVATMCVREHEVTIPYGVVETADGYLQRIHEKPKQTSFVNAGIYALNPEFVSYVPGNERSDMPTLLEAEMARGRKVSLFPIREYWMDIGHLDDFEKANRNFGDQFDVAVADVDEPKKPALRASQPRRKICVVSGSRADYGLLYWPMRAIDDAPDFELQVLATGMHLSERFGSTVEVIEGDGFTVAEKVPCPIDDNDPAAIASGMGEAVGHFAAAYRRLQPDLIFVLGDRFEILAAVQAAMIMGLPIAHLMGGDVTVGAFDDAIRHSISKMAHLHFVSNDESARRLFQLGEDPTHIWRVGNPGLDHLKNFTPMSRADFERSVGMTLRRHNLLVTYHPETRGARSAGDDLDELLAALDRLGGDFGIIMTRPNADPGSDQLWGRIDRFAERPNVCVHTSLGQQRYFSAMSHVDAMVGNSSSGLLEMPSFGKATVNIGGRQDGRPRAASVIDVTPERAAIVDAIRRAIRLDCTGVVNPYGDGRASGAIVEALRKAGDFNSLLRKDFFDWRDVS